RDRQRYLGDDGLQRVATPDWNARRARCAGLPRIWILRGGISPRSGRMEVELHAADQTAGRSAEATRYDPGRDARSRFGLAATFTRLAHQTHVNERADGILSMGSCHRGCHSHDATGRNWRRLAAPLASPLRVRKI